LTRSQISADFIFSIFALALLFLSFLHFAVSAGEDFSEKTRFFREFSGASIGGDRILLNPEEGLASREFGRAKNHLLRALPENGNYSGYCQFRTGFFNGEIVLFRSCGHLQTEDRSE